VPVNLQKVLLIGEKVQLRPIKATDAHAAYTMVKDENIIKWLLWDGPKNEQELSKTYNQWENDFGNKRDYYFAIEQINNPGIIGSIDLRSPEYIERAETGYWMAVPHWGNGYMTDAVRLVCYLGFKYLGLVKIYAPVFMGNTASKRVLEKNRFSSEGVLHCHHKKRGQWHDVWYMSLLRSAWKKEQEVFKPQHELIQT